MRYLLDTGALVFIVENSRVLTPPTEARRKEPKAIIRVSAVSVAELACGQEGGRIRLATYWKQWWAETLRRDGWECLSITPEIMAEAWRDA